MGRNTTYRIRDWPRLYEVNDRNREWKDGDKPRQGPLQYVRLSVHGASWTLGYRHFLEVAGDRAAASFGVFTKALEIAACQPAERRGVLLGRGDVPMEAEDLARATGFAVEDVARALDVLCHPDVRWLEVVAEYISREIPETPGKSRSDQIRSETDQRQIKTRQEEGEGASAPADVPSTPARDESVSSSETDKPKEAEAEAEFIQAWNSMAKTAGLPSMRGWTAKRRTAFRARMREPAWRDGWKEALAKVKDCPFLTGKNNRGWKLSVDFFLKPDSVPKICEGSYTDGRTTRHSEYESSNPRSPFG